MAVNHADGQLFLSVPFYPIAAGAGAAHAGAGWLTILFIPVGLAIGMGVCRVGRGIVYSVMGLGLSRSAKIQNRGLQTAAILPFFILYVVLPIAIAWGGWRVGWKRLVSPADLMMVDNTKAPNKRSALDARMVHRFHIEHDWLGASESER